MKFLWVGVGVKVKIFFACGARLLIASNPIPVPHTHTHTHRHIREAASRIAPKFCRNPEKAFRAKKVGGGKF